MLRPIVGACPAQNVSREDGAHLAAMRDQMKLEPDTERPGFGKISFEYPEKTSLNVLRDNATQAMGFQAHLERELERQGLREMYNEQFYEYVLNKVFVRLTQEEMEAWQGPVHYIVHHYVFKPGSASTKLRIVSNSSMGN